LFSTAKGNHVPVSAAAMQRGRAMFGGDDTPSTSAAVGAAMHTPAAATIFATGNGKSVHVSAAATMRATRLFSEDTTGVGDGAGAPGSSALVTPQPASAASNRLHTPHTRGQGGTGAAGAPAGGGSGLTFNSPMLAAARPGTTNVTARAKKTFASPMLPGRPRPTGGNSGMSILGGNGLVGGGGAGVGSVVGGGVKRIADNHTPGGDTQRRRMQGGGGVGTSGSGGGGGGGGTGGAPQVHDLFEAQRSAGTRKSLAAFFHGLKPGERPARGQSIDAEAGRAICTAQLAIVQFEA
jgi:hypothetical protein